MNEDEEQLLLLYVGKNMKNVFINGVGISPKEDDTLLSLLEKTNHEPRNIC